MGTEADRVDEEICKEAANFTKIFYDAMDRKREKINYLYCDSGATLVWNGNPVSGCDNIFKFISSLPETDHHLVSVDVQRINAGLPGSTNLLTITTAGTVILGGAVHVYMLYLYPLILSVTVRTMAELRSSYSSVTARTSSLHDACDRALAYQTALAAGAEQIQTNLHFFKQADVIMK
uniref:Conserved oligomeric Golgi complex subunit 3 n=1 Tax=Angiostrongylus cantonensis TaxID=6313 RepID=A0A0K0DAC5_ANGCA